MIRNQSLHVCGSLPHIGCCLGAVLLDRVNAILDDVGFDFCLVIQLDLEEEELTTSSVIPSAKSFVNPNT